MNSVFPKTCVTVAIAFFGLAGCETSPSKTTISAGDCTITQVDEVAKLRSGDKTADGRIKLINGRLIGPLDRFAEVGTYSFGGALSPDGHLMVVSNNGKEDPLLRGGAYPVGVTPQSETQSLSIVRIPEMTVVQTIPLPALFIGVAFSPDGEKLYAAGGGSDRVWTFVRNADPAGPPFIFDPAHDLGDGTSGLWVKGYPTGIEVSADGQFLAVTALHDHRVHWIELSTGASTSYEVRSQPYDVTIAPGNSHLYVSNWGDSSVSFIDLAAADPAAAILDHVLVGKNPEDIELSADGRTLYVAASDSDHVAVVDTATKETTRLITLSDTARGGLSPVALQLSADEQTLLVTLAGDNEVRQVSVVDGEHISSTTTGWYPSVAFYANDGTEVVAVSAKGDGAGSNEDNTRALQQMHGTVSVHTLPVDEPARKASIETATYNNNLAQQYFGATCARPVSPIPFAAGDQSPIKHVIYVVRENKTYDSLLGDLGTDADGDPSLTVFGEQYTPNLHALARQFVNHDNFYNESEQSLQGHIWLGSGWSNDFSEKAWLAMWGRLQEPQFFLPGMEPIAVGQDGTLFDHFYTHGVKFRSYGELVGIGAKALSEMRDSVNLEFPPFAMHIKDTEKLKIFIDDLKRGQLAPFTMVWLPNDHTYGVSAGKPTPQAMVADNDYATGQLVEAVSHSPFWPSTAIFIFEDDPQGTPDHVDVHRSVLVVASPWAKRSHTSSVSSSFPALHRTTELIFGLPPQSRYNALAAPLYDAFATVPDTTPYVAIDPGVPYDHFRADLANAPGQAESEGADFTFPDQAPQLGIALWKHMRPGEPYPSAMAAEMDEDEPEEEREKMEAIVTERQALAQ